MEFWRRASKKQCITSNFGHLVSSPYKKNPHSPHPRKFGGRKISPPPQLILWLSRDLGAKTHLASNTFNPPPFPPAKRTNNTEAEGCQGSDLQQLGFRSSVGPKPTCLKAQATVKTEVFQGQSGPGTSTVSGCKVSSFIGDGRNTVSRALFGRELTEFCSKLGESYEEFNEFALAHKQ